MDETLHPNPCRVSPQSERRLWPRQVPSADTLYLPLAVVAHAHSTASAGYLTPSPRARAAPPGGGDAPATSPVFSRRVLTRQLSAPFCCRSPSQAAVPSPWSRCKLYLLRLGLSGQDGKQQEKVGKVSGPFSVPRERMVDARPPWLAARTSLHPFTLPPHRGCVKAAPCLPSSAEPVGASFRLNLDAPDAGGGQ